MEFELIPLTPDDDIFTDRIGKDEPNFIIDAKDGNDIVVTGYGDDKIFGGNGHDSLSSSFGNDTILGNRGKDTLSGFDGDDILNGGKGHDDLNGEAGNDYLVGGSGNDSLNGGTGKDNLFGGDGHDHLLGGSDDDTLDGGKGRNTLTGGDGSDVFVLDAKSSKNNLITDFTPDIDTVEFKRLKDQVPSIVETPLGSQVYLNDRVFAIFEGVFNLSVEDLNYQQVLPPITTEYNTDPLS